MEPQPWVQQLLTMQREQTAQTWAAAHLRAINEATPIVIDFHFSAPDPGTADGLVAYLRAETPWEVGTVGFTSGLMGRHEWEVSGRTQRREVDLPLLQEWAAWMVVIGADHGCRFGQWSISGPEPFHVKPAS